MQEIISSLINTPTALYFVVGVFSLCIGSFLNVVIYRTPKMMEQEWHQVWPRSYLKAWQPDPMLTLTVFKHAEFVDEPPRCPLRCKDPDDQVFIDLALHVGAQWLFSKDAALLKLAKRAKLRGTQVMTLQQWTPVL
mgnify:CR=1 FL=1